MTGADDESGAEMMDDEEDGEDKDEGGEDESAMDEDGKLLNPLCALSPP
jgi:hypothetical protein